MTCVNLDDLLYFNLPVMISALNRLIPFINRSSRNAQTINQTSQPALTQQLEDSDLSSSWLTLSHNDIDNFDYKAGQTREPSSPGDSRLLTKRKLSNRSLALFNGAISRIPFGPKGEYIIEEDISNGRENSKVPAVSYKRHDCAPSDYHYVTEHIQYNPIPLDSSFSLMSGCQCVEDCTDSKCNCSSLVYPASYYDQKGRLSSDYNIEAPEIIFECNALCKCNPKVCKNMVIQAGSKVKVMLFKTKSRGWGVRTLEDLKRGTFIGIYSGELISAEDSYQRDDDTYLFNLSGTHVYYVQEPKVEGEQVLSGVDDEHQLAPSQTSAPSPRPIKDQYVCDAKHYGNFTRFINHSCEPNVIGIKSYTIHHDTRFPYIAFFTNKYIPANSELTLNYGDNYWLVKCKRDKVYCLCKRSNCRFTRKTFPQTLKAFERQKRQNQREEQKKQQQH